MRKSAVALLVSLIVTALLPGSTSHAAAAPAELISIAFPTSAMGQQIDVGVRLTGPLDRWTLRLAITATPVSTRSGLNAPDTATRVVSTVAGSDPVDEGQERDVSVRATLGRLDAGAYPSRLDLLSDGRVLQSITFFTPVLSSRTTRPTPITLLWPIIDRPHVGIDGVFLDDDLAAQIADGGRLDELVRAGARGAVVWVIDPGLLSAIETMSTGYSVAVGGERIEREASLDAGRWLLALRAATTGREVIVLPFGDPDLLSIAKVGAERLASARAGGIAIAARVLDRAPATLLTDVALPAGGQLAETTTGVAAQNGFTSVLTQSRSVPAIEGSTATPSGRGAKIDGVDLLVADAVASSWLSRSDAIAATRMLAEIATIAGERPAQPRSQVLMPDRRWNPSRAALNLVITQLAPHLQPWRALLSEAPQVRGAIAFGGSTYSRNHLAVAGEGWRQVAMTEKVLGLPMEQSELLAGAPLASSLRDYTPVGFLQKVAASGRALVNGVHVLPGRYTLTAKEQQIPVTVVNEFDHPARVFVTVAPHAPRVIVRPTPVVEVPARGRTQVLVPVTSVATGTVAADAYLLSIDGRRFGDGEVLTIDVRSIGPVANWVLVGSTALLALAVALRLTRRIRQVRRERREQEQA
jgi:hypothetical protein